MYLHFVLVFLVLCTGWDIVCVRSFWQCCNFCWGNPCKYFYRYMHKHTNYLACKSAQYLMLAIELADFRSMLMF